MANCNIARIKKKRVGSLVLKKLLIVRVVHKAGKNKKWTIGNRVLCHELSVGIIRKIVITNIVASVVIIKVAAIFFGSLTLDFSCFFGTYFNYARFI